jgi:hypothetical protein
MWTTMTMTGGVDGASLKIGAKSFTEEALLAAITKIELGNPGIDSYGGQPSSRIRVPGSSSEQWVRTAAPKRSHERDQK